ncbi:hypothetical protein [Kitasatospora sp. NPDC056531]|uniref:hypothetical protein n=1 Tax=Kitasatospora sp. NPDC056531 TaxID=3345856 RepID=UPI0036CF3B1E
METIMERWAATGEALYQAQDQDGDRSGGGRAARPLRPAEAGVALLHQVAVPAQDGVRVDQQSQATQDLARQRSEERGEQSAVLRSELRPVRAELALKGGELMAQGEDLHILVPVAHRQQPQGSERVGNSQVCQTEQHE